PSREPIELLMRVAVVHQASSRSVAVAQHHMAPRVVGGIAPSQADQTCPLSIVVIVFVHDLYLPEVDRFTTDVNVSRRLIIEPELGFHPAFVRDLSISAHRPSLPSG